MNKITDKITDVTAFTIPARWVRLPAAKEVCPYTGLKRGSLLNLAKRSGGKIRSVHLKEPGRKRGNRLFWLPSIFAYLDELADDACASETMSDVDPSDLPCPDDLDR